MIRLPLVSHVAVNCLVKVRANHHRLLQAGNSLKTIYSALSSLPDLIRLCVECTVIHKSGKKLRRVPLPHNSQRKGRQSFFSKKGQMGGKSSSPVRHPLEPAVPGGNHYRPDDVTAQLQTLVDDFWAWRMKNSPEFATTVGTYDYNDKMEELTLAAFDRKYTEAGVLLSRLVALRRDLVAADQQVTYDVLKYNLETLTDGYQWRRFTHSMVSSQEGPHQGINPKIIKLTPFHSKNDFDIYLKRLKAFGVQINQFIDLMKDSIRTGLTLHKASVYTVPDEITASLQTPSTDSLYYSPFAVDIENIGLHAKTIDDLRNRAKTVIEEDIYGALRKLYNFITDDYIPKCRPNISVSSLPDGAEFYKAALKWHLSIDMEPEDVHQLGLREVDRIKAQMDTVMKQVGFSGSLKEFIAHLKKDPQFFYKSVDELLQGYRDILTKRIMPVIPNFFKNPPNLPVVIQASKFGAEEYVEVSSDGKFPGVFNVDVRSSTERPKCDMISLTLHEVSPGHHLQTSSMMVAKGLPMFRQHIEFTKYHAVPFHFPFFTAHAEGWSLYSEYLGEEMGLYETPYELFGRYVSEIFRACRLVVDTGIHVKNWTYDQALDYMSDHLTDPLPMLRAEIDRYISTPGQACAYKVGELKIKEIRKNAEAALGRRFNVKDFHEQCLMHGSLPLDLLETLVDNWTKQVEVKLRDEV